MQTLHEPMAGRCGNTEVSNMKEALETLFDLIETNCYDWREALHAAAAKHNVNYFDLWDAYDQKQ